MKTKRFSRTWVLAISLAGLAIPLMTSAAYSKEERKSTDSAVHGAKSKVKQKMMRKAKPRKKRSVKREVSQAQQFCGNIRDQVLEKRYALKKREIEALHAVKKRQLEDLRAEVQKRIDTLEIRRIKFEKWVVRRDNFSAMATKSIVDIYTKMRPDAAASRLEELGEVLAAAILLKMSSRKAGVILNEMKAVKAAEITRVIASSGRKDKQT